MRAEKFHATGSIRTNRKGRTDDGISYVTWMDKRIVLLASNCENPCDTDNVIRKKKNELLTIYNKNMGYGDAADMLKEKHEIDRKSKKW